MIHEPQPPDSAEPPKPVTVDKFKIAFDPKSGMLAINYMDLCELLIYPADLADLSAAAFSALADQQVERSATEEPADKLKGCKCESGWTGDCEAICTEFVRGSMKAEWCETCGHDRACHGSQNGN